MNKKIISLLLLLILLVSVIVTYTYLNQLEQENTHTTDFSKIVDQNTVTNEIDSTLLNENQGIEIGEMI